MIVPHPNCKTKTKIIVSVFTSDFLHDHLEEVAGI